MAAGNCDRFLAAVLVRWAWQPCLCAGPGSTGHLRVSCRADGCTSAAWYRPRHVEGQEVTSRPG